MSPAATAIQSIMSRCPPLALAHRLKRAKAEITPVRRKTKNDKFHRTYPSQKCRKPFDNTSSGENGSPKDVCFRTSVKANNRLFTVRTRQITRLNRMRRSVVCFIRIKNQFVLRALRNRQLNEFLDVGWILNVLTEKSTSVVNQSPRWVPRLILNQHTFIASDMNTRP
jgi:hypothetical protein